jgi:hypothetical protein
VPHRARPKHVKSRPVLVSLRATLTCLTNHDVLLAVKAALEGASRWDPESFRIAHSSVHPDRVDLLVYASANRTLSGGIRSVTIRIARGVNDVLGRSGRFWADRWDGREIQSSRELSQVLAKLFESEIEG